MTKPVHPFFATFKQSPGSWIPPQYPEIDDPSWQVVFKHASEHERVDLANLWSWRFIEQMRGVSKMTQLGKLAPYQQWLKDIKPYFDASLFNAHTPYTVLWDHIKDRLGSRLETEDRELTHQYITQLWFTEPQEAIQAVAPLGLLFSQYVLKTPISQELLLLAQHLAWDTIKMAKNEDPQVLLGALRLSILAGLADIDIGISPVDSRSRAWQALGTSVKRPLSQSNEKLLDKVKAEETIQQMHPIAVVEGVFVLFQVLAGQNAARNFELQIKHPICPTEKNGNIWDVFRYLIPSEKGLWDTAQSLDMQPATAAQQLYEKLNPDAVGVTIPDDIIVNNMNS